jgi:hypothetical protein
MRKIKLYSSKAAGRKNRSSIFSKFNGMLRLRIAVHLLTVTVIYLALSFGSLDRIYQNLFAHVVPSVIVVGLMYAFYFASENFVILLASFTVVKGIILIILFTYIDNNKRFARRNKLNRIDTEQEFNVRGLGLSDDEQSSEEEREESNIMRRESKLKLLNSKILSSKNDEIVLEGVSTTQYDDSESDSDDSDDSESSY